MSFILDALRKSERERQRQAAPGIADATYRAPSRSQKPWLLAVGVILIVNAVLVAVLLLRDEPAATTARTVQPASVPAAAPAPERRPAPRAAPRDDLRELEEEAAPAASGTAARQEASAARSPAGSLTTVPPSGDTTATGTPALPSMEQLVLEGRLEMPPLRLDMHVFSEQPAQRFVFINMNKYREGDTLKEGPQVEGITADGVVLSYRGNRFLLTR